MTVNEPGEYLRNHPHFIQGREYERQRILALFQAHATRDDAGADAGYIDEPIEVITDLIEGNEA